MLALGRHFATPFPGTSTSRRFDRRGPPHHARAAAPDRPMTGARILNRSGSEAIVTCLSDSLADLSIRLTRLMRQSEPFGQAFQQG